MARTFDDGTPDFMELGSAGATAAPMALAFWGKSDNTVALQCGLFLGDKDVANHYWGLAFSGDGADELGFYVNAAAQVIATSGAYTVDTWHHALALEASASSRFCGIDGTLGTEETTSTVPAGADLTAIGHFGDATPGFEFSGSIQWPAVWSVELDTLEIAKAAAGYEPVFMRRDSLAFFARCVHDDDYDQVSGTKLTVTGTPGLDHSTPDAMVRCAPRGRGRGRTRLEAA